MDLHAHLLEDRIVAHLLTVVLSYKVREEQVRSLAEKTSFFGCVLFTSIAYRLSGFHTSHVQGMLLLVYIP